MSRCLRVDFPCATATPGLHLLPVAKAGAAPLTKGSRDSVRVISSLTFEHLYSSTRLEIGRERAPLPYSPILLRHLGSPSHFLTCTFTNRSSRLAWDRVTSYMEIGHMRRGSSPNCRHQSFSFPGRAVLLICFRPLIVSCLSCSTCSASLRSVLYRRPRLLMGLTPG